MGPNECGPPPFQFGSLRIDPQIHSAVRFIRVASSRLADAASARKTSCRSTEPTIIPSLITGIRPNPCGSTWSSNAVKDMSSVTVPRFRSSHHMQIDLNWSECRIGLPSHFSLRLTKWIETTYVLGADPQYDGFEYFAQWQLALELLRRLLSFQSSSSTLTNSELFRG